MKTKKLQYPCTECGGDAFVGMSNWSGPNGKIIGKDERLCIRCSKKRGLDSPFTSQKDAK